MGNKEYELWERWGGEQSDKSVHLGAHTSYKWCNSRRKILFTAASYKFAMKMIGNIYDPGEKEILELGCNDGFGTHFIAEAAKKVIAVDFDEEAIQSAMRNSCDQNVEYKNEDFLGKKYGEFDGIVSFDVIEHIYPENEGKFMDTVLMNLKQGGTFVIGCPSQEHQQYSAECIKKSHVNTYMGEDFYAMLKKYFYNVYLFTQNDEYIHTGHLRMANSLVAVCSNKKCIDE